MPYIDDDNRIFTDAYGPQDRDALTYALTRMLVRYVDRAGQSSESFGDCLAACEIVKLEFYRRVVGPRQDAMLDENGDVTARWSSPSGRTAARRCQTEQAPGRTE